MVPVIVTPESEGLYSQLTPEQREIVGKIGDIIKKIVQRSLFIGNHYTNLNSFIQVSNDQILHTLQTCLEIEDSSGVDLVVSIFLSHFANESNFIHFPVNELVSTVILFIKYKKSTELLAGRDVVYGILDQIGDIGSEVTNSIENYKVNLQMNNSFLYDQEEVSICSLCGVPMPKKLALQGQKPETIVKTMKTDESGFIDSIEVVCRKIPKFSAQSLKEVSENLIKITEILTNVTFIQGNAPNYKVLFDLKIANEKINDLISRNYSIEYLLFEVSKRMTERHSQRVYLKKLNEGVHFIKNAQKDHLEFLRQKEIDLKLSLENVTLFRTNLDPTEKEMKKMAFFRLEKTHLTEIKKKKLHDMPLGIEHEIVGEVSIVFLEKIGVLERIAYGFSRDTKRGLNLHYSHSKTEG